MDGDKLGWTRLRALGTTLAATEIDWRRPLRPALDSSQAVIAIDVLETEFTIRQFADGAVTQIARCPRSDPEVLKRALAPYATKTWLLRDDFVLRFPAQTMLRRPIQLPAAARGKLSDIVRHEVDRQSPVDSTLVYYDYRATGIDPQTQQLDVILRIVARAPVDEALAACRAAGVVPCALLAIDDERLGDGGNLPVDRTAVLQAQIKRHLVTALALSAVILAIACLAALYFRNQAATDELMDRVARARFQGRQVERLERDIEGTRKAEMSLFAQKRDLKTLRIIAEITRVLPEGSFLSELHVRGDDVELIGLSKSAASLIAQFDSSPLFANAQFRAPLTQGPLPATDRFDLAFRVREGGR
ncbi:MAG TPA: PilN domain-containing protein [Rhizomicrobium sp.]|jgi:general secretion pathway protein L